MVIQRIVEYDNIHKLLEDIPNQVNDDFYLHFFNRVDTKLIAIYRLEI